jgi:hypothetical protein
VRGVRIRSGVQRPLGASPPIRTSTTGGLAGEDAGEPFLAMELLEGESLSARLRRGPLTVRQALGLGEEILSALAALHADMGRSGAEIVDLDWMVDLDDAVRTWGDEGPAPCGNFDPVSVMLRGTPAANILAHSTTLWDLEPSDR